MWMLSAIWFTVVSRVVLRVDPHPVPGRPGELDHLGRRIAPQQVVLQLDRVRLIQKRANLHAPLPAGSTPGRSGGAYASTRTFAVPGR